MRIDISPRKDPRPEEPRSGVSKDGREEDKGIPQTSFGHMKSYARLPFPSGDVVNAWFSTRPKEPRSRAMILRL
jgi:hypothetical protein